MLNQLLKRTTYLATIVIGLAAVGIASADEVNVAGFTLGRFDAQGYASTNSLLDLSYSNSTFDNTTVGGTLDLGGNPNPGANFNNLGSFTLGLTNDTYDGNTFNLLANFTAPTVIAGGSSSIFSDKLYGTVRNDLGGVFIDFNNTPQTFLFSNGAAAGWFTLFINDVSVAPGQTASLTGHIMAYQQAVPEPSSLVVLGLGAFGLARFVRRQRKV